ncbi:MAG: hypothetical protein AAF862_10405 [Pseudomonadota bacterium]
MGTLLFLASTAGASAASPGGFIVLAPESRAAPDIQTAFAIRLKHAVCGVSESDTVDQFAGVMAAQMGMSVQDLDIMMQSMGEQSLAEMRSELAADSQDNAQACKPTKSVSGKGWRIKGGEILNSAVADSLSTTWGSPDAAHGSGTQTASISFPATGSVRLKATAAYTANFSGINRPYEVRTVSGEAGQLELYALLPVDNGGAAKTVKLQTTLRGSGGDVKISVMGSGSTTGMAMGMLPGGPPPFNLLLVKGGFNGEGPMYADAPEQMNRRDKIAAAGAMAYIGSQSNIKPVLVNVGSQTIEIDIPASKPGQERAVLITMQGAAQAGRGLSEYDGRNINIGKNARFYKGIEERSFDVDALFTLMP